MNSAGTETTEGDVGESNGVKMGETPSYLKEKWQNRVFQPWELMLVSPWGSESGTQVSIIPDLRCGKVGDAIGWCPHTLPMGPRGGPNPFIKPLPPRRLPC